jgi:hypothetical protein
MEKIKRVSMFFRVLFQMSFIALPILLVCFWIQAPTSIGLHALDITMSFIPKGVEILNPLSPMAKFLGFLISLIPNALSMLIIYFLIKLFKLYENGKIFTFENVNYIKKIGYTLLITELVDPIYQVFMTATLTWGNPHGHRVASITISGIDFGTILVALLTILISWIMAEGCKLNEEQQLTI